MFSSNLTEITFYACGASETERLKALLNNIDEEILLFVSDLENTDCSRRMKLGCDSNNRAEAVTCAHWLIFSLSRRSQI